MILKHAVFVFWRGLRGVGWGWVGGGGAAFIDAGPDLGKIEPVLTK